MPWVLACVPGVRAEMRAGEAVEVAWGAGQGSASDRGDRISNPHAAAEVSRILKVRILEIRVLEIKILKIK